jgi:probable rRNA maturation factor
MALKIDIYNRQRRIEVQVTRLSKVVERLAVGVFEELNRLPPRWLKRKHLRQFEQRGMLSLMLVSNAKIRQLNRQFRGKDYATDVVSFPLVVSEDGDVSIFPGDQTLELGEMIISLEKAEEQASEYGHSFEREFAFLFTHGLLHVLGFDHETKLEEKEMFGRQNKILLNAGFPRS